MSLMVPEFEYVDRGTETIRYLEHGWPTPLCRWHSHSEYELHLILATSGKAFVGDYIGEFRSGYLYMTGPNLPHNWVTDEVAYPKPVLVRDMLVQFSQESINHLSCGFSEFNELSQMFELASSGIEFTGFRLKSAQRHFKNIRDSVGAERIVAFLKFLVRINEHENKRALSVVKLSHYEINRNQKRINNVVDHITRNYSQELSLAQVADMAAMSPTSFSRNFRKMTGNRFVEFVNRVRIGQACSMLYSTDEPISGIGFEVGFQNLANFNRQFLKMKEMTPSAYRTIARKELKGKGI